MYAESINNADVSMLSTGGGRGTIDVITSSTGTASGCGNAADVITSSLDGTGGRGSADIITSRGSIEVITSSLDGANGRGSAVDVVD